MKPRCWKLLCFLFLGDLVRLSRADDGTKNFDLVQLNTENGDSGEGSGYLRKPIVKKESAGYGVGLLMRKNKHLCPLGIAKIGIAKASGRRSIREDDVPLVSSEPNVRGKKCPCNKIKKKPRPEVFTRKRLDTQLLNSNETSFTHNRRSKTLFKTTNSIEHFTNATERSLRSNEISFSTSPTSATATTFYDKIVEDGRTNIDIKDETTMPFNAELKDVRRTKVDLPGNLNSTYFTTDSTESSKINDSARRVNTTERSTYVLTTVFEGITKWPPISRNASLEARRNIIQVTAAPKKSPRKKKCKRKRKKIKTVVPLVTLKPIDSGHLRTTRSSPAPTSGRSKPVTRKSTLPKKLSTQKIPSSSEPTSSSPISVTHKPKLYKKQTHKAPTSPPPTSGQSMLPMVNATLGNREIQTSQPTLAPTSVTVKTTLGNREIQTTQPNPLQTTRQTTTVTHKPAVIVHRPPADRPHVHRPPVYRPPVQQPPVYRPPVTKKPATKWIYYKFTPWTYPAYVAPTYRPYNTWYNSGYKPSYGFGPIYNILKAKYNLLKRLGR